MAEKEKLIVVTVHSTGDGRNNVVLPTVDIETQNLVKITSPTNKDSESQEEKLIVVTVHSTGDGRNNVVLPTVDAETQRLIKLILPNTNSELLGESDETDSES